MARPRSPVAPTVDPILRAALEAADDAGLNNAEVAQTCGVVVPTVSAWRAGKYAPDTGTVARLLDRLGLAVRKARRKQQASS